MSDKQRSISVLVLAALAYFVAYPEDAQAITALISILLGLTTAISPWFYGVVAVGIMAAAVVKTWGGRQGA